MNEEVREALDCLRSLVPSAFGIGSVSRDVMEEDLAIIERSLSELNDYIGTLQDEIKTLQEQVALKDEWLCEACNTVFPYTALVRDKVLPKCPECGGFPEPKWAHELRVAQYELKESRAATERLWKDTAPRRHYSGDIMNMSGHREFGYHGIKCPVCGAEEYGGSELVHKKDCAWEALRPMFDGVEENR